MLLLVCICIQFNMGLSEKLCSYEEEGCTGDPYSCRIVDPSVGACGAAEQQKFAKFVQVSPDNYMLRIFFDAQCSQQILSIPVAENECTTVPTGLVSKIYILVTSDEPPTPSPNITLTSVVTTDVSGTAVTVSMTTEISNTVISKPPAPAPPYNGTITEDDAIISDAIGQVLLIVGNLLLGIGAIDIGTILSGNLPIGALMGGVIGQGMLGGLGGGVGGLGGLGGLGALPLPIPFAAPGN